METTSPKVARRAVSQPKLLRTKTLLGDPIMKVWNGFRGQRMVGRNIVQSAEAPIHVAEAGTHCWPVLPIVKCIEIGEWMGCGDGDFGVCRGVP